MVKQVKTLVNQVVQPNAKVGLIGHFKDESSYYLALFPEWEMVELDSLKILFQPRLCEKPIIGERFKLNFSQGTIRFLKNFKIICLSEVAAKF